MSQSVDRQSGAISERQGENQSDTPAESGAVTLNQMVRVWARIGLLSFGGPAAQIALMHKEIVEKRQWLSEQQYLSALSFCMLLPGPEAMQLATYSGWRLRGTLGGLIAGLLFVIPGALLILVLAALYALYGNVPIVQALFLGVKAAVLVIVLEALLKISKRALLGTEHWLIAALAFFALFFLAIPFPLVIALAALWGFFRVKEISDTPISANPITNNAPTDQSTDLARLFRTVLIWLALWFAPLIILAVAFPDSVLNEIGRFFSILATVTFGGAYAVLAYMADRAVSFHAWLSAAEMADALGLAETTPGPLILVTEFVGFLAAARAQGSVNLLSGMLGALLTLWVTFVPCFLWVFAGAPYIERLQSMPRLDNALRCVTAAVVGVILNLSLWFALQVMFSQVTRVQFAWLTPWLPALETIDWRVPLISMIAAVLLLYRHWGVVATLMVCAIAGFILH